MWCLQCDFSPCACGKEDYQPFWAVICLGNEPLNYGPFRSELAADEWLEGEHCPASEEYPLGHCINHINADEHHVLEMR